MSDLLARLGVELPVVQAGMGGGISRHELAAAVSEAGGLGTICTLPPDTLRGELRSARERTSKPIAVNLLLPFARRAHFEAAAEADVVVTFWGGPRRRTAGPWLHQCGSVAEARAAHAAGADGVIVQGVEAGGHVRGVEPALELLARVRDALPSGYPVLVAGGLADARDVRAALDAGAHAAVLGTRFLMSEESRARPAYKQRLLEARETVLTELFGFGWPAPHRVIWNEAAERWLTREDRTPGWLRALNRASAPLGRLAFVERLAARVPPSPSLPLLSPLPPTDGAPKALLDAGPLYAGESVARIQDIRPAGELTRALAGS
ncbi:MAG: nitronate monooxygenase [Thermoleophilaceae bacterium]|nr:nitronate monooxygenase [Thermoleophilaceae bacterium]